MAGVHDEPATANFYLAKLAKAADRADLVEPLKAEIETAKTEGPYGAFPAGPPIRTIAAREEQGRQPPDIHT